MTIYDDTYDDGEPAPPATARAFFLGIAACCVLWLICTVGLLRLAGVV